MIFEYYMNKAYLLTGGNMSKREENLHLAIEHLQLSCGRVTKLSSIYETAAWGNTGQPAFLNQAVEIETELAARQLMHCILNVEKCMGRVRNEKYGPRLIDIDILLYNDEIHHNKLLNLPHPEMQNRKFALIPLAEIAPGIIHPLLKKTIKELLKDCKDELEVKKYS